MKRIGLAILAVVVIASLGVGVAFAGKPPLPPSPDNEGIDKAKVESPAIDEDGNVIALGLEKITFIHWKEGFAKPTCNNNGTCEPDLGENPSCADCKNGEEDPDPTDPTAACYDFLGQYGKKLLKWGALPVSYVINPTSPVPEKLLLTEDQVKNAIYLGAEEWDANTSADLFSSYSVDYNATYGVQDYMNAITWDNYPTEGVIAVATIWYNPATKTIVEFDIMFDTDWTWGDADGNPDVMDLQNIATHELGHGVGLADVYEAECSAVTMYGYSDYGETQKRDLDLPDITGIQELYGGP